MSRTSPARPRASTAWSLCLLLLLLGTVQAGYFTLRYAGRWSDSDTGFLTAAIRAVEDEGTLLPTRAFYSLGFAYQSVSAFITLLTGIEPVQLQFHVYPLIASMLSVLAFAMYQALTGSAAAGALATLLLFLQPDFLFVVFRGSHEKVTWLGAMLAMYLLARSFREAREPRRFLGYVMLFYLAAFALIASNTFFGSSFVVAVSVSLFAGVLLLGMWERRRPGGIRPTVARLTYVVAAAMVLWFLAVFYLYPPAMSFLTNLRTTADRAGAVTAGLEQRYDVAASVGEGWLNRGVYLGITSPTWVMAAVSFAIWAGLGARILLSGKVPQDPSRFLLWLLYGGFGIQLAAGLVLAAAGGVVVNLQVRLFPAVMLMACALVAATFHALWRRWAGRFPRAVLVLVLIGFVLWAGLAAPLKVTNEPALASYWNFWTVPEEVAMRWADNHATYAIIWLGPSVLRTYGRAVASEFGRDNRNLADATAVELETRDLLISDMDAQLAQRVGFALPDVRHENRLYDNGGSQMYRKVARTPFQK